MSHDVGAPSAPQWPPHDVPATLRIVKVSPEGAVVTEYPGIIVPEHCHGEWICIEAQWTFRRIEIDGLVFEPGDRLLEWFSSRHWFNVFAVHAPSGAYRGAYANVTFPTAFDPLTDPPTLAWRDLYLDLILLPDGTAITRDEDELEESGLAQSDPALHRRILAGFQDLQVHLHRRESPFEGLNYRE
jgi:uncharacterized protein